MHVSNTHGSSMQGAGLQEKVMVNDALASVKSSLTTYANVISECSSPQLRSAIQQIRNSCETSQYELYKIAQSKGYYQPATMADDSEVNQVRSEFGGSSGNMSSW
ncbi:MAG: spore coat protein [Christensenellales bacterium]|jgi:spore coat protein CotF